MKNIRFDYTVNEILHFKKMFKNKMLEHKREILDNFDNDTFTKETYFNIIHSEDLLFSEFSQIVFLHSVHRNDEIRNAAIEIEDEVTMFLTKLNMDTSLYHAYKILFNRFKTRFICSKEEIKYFNYVLRKLETNGLHKDKSTQDELVKIEEKLINLSSIYSKNLNESNDTLNFSLIELDGLSEEFINTLEKTQNGKYIVTTKYDHVDEVRRYCSNETTRRKITELFKNRGKYKGNHLLLQEAIRLRHRKAKLLGFDNYINYKLSYNSIAKNEGMIQEFLSNIMDRVLDMGKKDIQVLMKYSDKEKIGEWDIPYYMNLYTENVLDVNSKTLQKYFPLDTVLPEILHCFEDLLTLSIFEENLDKSQTWHDDVKCFRVMDKKTDSIYGYFYIDLYPRKNKFEHAAAFSIHKTYIYKGIRNIPVSAMVCNFTRPSQENPSLLKFNEMVTFFHELGHIFHQLLSQNTISLFSGTSVERDFVECPSQALENWCYEPSFLLRITKHVDTGNTMPYSIINKIYNMKRLFRGYSMIRQLIYAFFDLNIHNMNVENTNVLDMYNKIENLILPDTIIQSSSCVPANFFHLMGGYECNYYGYLWSEVHAAELFNVFKESGDLFNYKLGLKYRQCILEKGGTENALLMLYNFLGRQPTSDCFFSTFEYNEKNTVK